MKKLLIIAALLIPSTARAAPDPPTGPVVETCAFLPAGTPCPRPRPPRLCEIIPIIPCGRGNYVL